MYLSIDTPSRSVRSARISDEEVVILGGEGHKVGQDPDTRARYAALEAWARGQFPVTSIEYRWSAQDQMPVDDVPFVGPLAKGSERIFVATGFKKWGMTNGSAAGVMLANRLSGADNDYADFFDTDRRNPRQSIAELVKENANVVKRFVGDRLRTESRSADDLAVGEAVRFSGYEADGELQDWGPLVGAVRGRRRRPERSMTAAIEAHNRMVAAGRVRPDLAPTIWKPSLAPAASVSFWTLPVCGRKDLHPTRPGHFSAAA